VRIPKSIRVATLFGALAALCLLGAAPVQALHPRPKAANTIQTSLVPAYPQCTAANRTHGPPLAFASCAPPAQTSAQATMGTPDAFGGAPNFTGYVRWRWIGGAPNPADDPDILINMSLSDVRCVPAGAGCGGANAPGPADYAGEVRLAWTIRNSDHFNAVAPGGGTDPATVEDHSIGKAVACTETASTSTGSACNVATSVNAIIAGIVRPVKRAVWEYVDVNVYDGGVDGVGDTTADNTVFLRPGVFIP
jgi:hypothetical protein